jgi:hypothetical protein
MVTSILLGFISCFDAWHASQILRACWRVIIPPLQGKPEAGLFTQAKQAASWLGEGLRLITMTLEIFYGNDLTRKHIFVFILFARTSVVFLVGMPLTFLFSFSEGQWEPQVSLLP